MISCDDVVYVAGRMSNVRLFNYPAFFAMAGMIEKSYRCRVLNPARQPDGLAYEEYMERAFQDLNDASVVVLLDGWAFSPGANREFFYALKRNIKIISQRQIEHDIEKIQKGEK